MVGKRGAIRDAAADLFEACRLGLLLEGDDVAFVVEQEDAHLCRCFEVHRLRGDRDLGAAPFVGSDEIGVVHPVQMVTREDEVVVGWMLAEVSRRLAHGVGCPLIPVRVIGCLLGREDLHESAGEPIEPVGIRDVTVERGRVELRQHEDATDIGVQASADRNVDEAVLPTDRNSRLGTSSGQWEET